MHSRSHYHPREICCFWLQNMWSRKNSLEDPLMVFGTSKRSYYLKKRSSAEKEETTVFFESSTENF
ncbi:hypothetical protein LR48_Vigan04g098200 [Vigna angularis]|uniref:Uncharacterized protein n=1 Tax=Phaseolus angularis TaxID=3914 RepID=A0A0L9UE14_PHAAN|nr:hypothetical protein LR48_Vigan04g098200 [Vigna angularis]